MTDPSALPVIDFAAFKNGTATQRRAIAAEIGAACRQDGFFVLQNHQLDKSLTDGAFAAAHAFFDQPLADKQAISIDKSPCHRGWYGEGGEILDGENQPQGDFKEGLKIGRDLSADHPRVVAGLPLHGANQWPNSKNINAAGGFEHVMQSCYDACEALSRQLMQAFALSLDLSEDYFDRWLSLPMATLSPLRYPPMRDAAILNAGAHTDFGCLTLLFQTDEAGLEVARPNGEWLRVPCFADLIIVNIGDMMARWTNDIYRSTRHRVVNRSGRTRHSLAFFFDPDPDADLTALPGCIKKGDAPHYPTACALDHLLAKIEDSFAYRQETQK